MAADMDEALKRVAAAQNEVRVATCPCACVLRVCARVCCVQAREAATISIVAKRLASERARMAAALDGEREAHEATRQQVARLSASLADVEAQVRSTFSSRTT